MRRKWYTHTQKKAKARTQDSGTFPLNSVYRNCLEPLQLTKARSRLLRHPTRTHIRSRRHDKRMPLCKERDSYIAHQLAQHTETYIYRICMAQHTPHNITSRKREDETTPPDSIHITTYISTRTPGKIIAVKLILKRRKRDVRLIIALWRKKPCTETGQDHEYESDYDTCSVLKNKDLSDNVYGLISGGSRAHPFAMVMLLACFLSVRAIRMGVEDVKGIRRG